MEQAWSPSCATQPSVWYALQPSSRPARRMPVTGGAVPPWPGREDGRAQQMRRQGLPARREGRRGQEALLLVGWLNPTARTGSIWPRCSAAARAPTRRSMWACWRRWQRRVRSCSGISSRLKAAPAKDTNCDHAAATPAAPAPANVAKAPALPAQVAECGAQGTAGRHKACPGQDRQARADDTRGTAFRERRGGRRAEAQGDLQEVHPADRRGSDGAVLTFT